MSSIRILAFVGVFLALCGIEAQASPSPTNSLHLGGRECAERIILLAAKKNVAENFDDSPTSHGLCAKGVRTSLQNSLVGDVNGSLGNAIDFLLTTRPHGFMDSGARDPRTAPPGTVLVFSGPKSAEYLRTGEYGRPAGTWLGHVTIKGDDGRYYTDGRTREPALGWQNNQNEKHIRNVAGILVPGNSLAAKYVGKCDRLFEEEARISLELAANDARNLDIYSVDAEAEGKSLAQEGLAQLEKLGALGNRPEDFREVLRLTAEAGPFDEEGQLTQAVAQSISNEPGLRSVYQSFLLWQPKRSAAEICKLQRLAADVAREECLMGSQLEGQDMGLPMTKSCGRPFAYASCLKDRN